MERTTVRIFVLQALRWKPSTRRVHDLQKQLKRNNLRICDPYGLQFVNLGIHWGNLRNSCSAVGAFLVWGFSSEPGSSSCRLPLWSYVDQEWGPVLKGRWRLRREALTDVHYRNILLFCTCFSPFICILICSLILNSIPISIFNSWIVWIWNKVAISSDSWVEKQQQQ